MPFFVEIRRPSNDLLLAHFSMWKEYFYRFKNGVEFPLSVEYAWCHKCEAFVEIERLKSLAEIEKEVSDLESSRDRWSEIDLSTEKHFAAINHTMPPSCKQQAIFDKWSAALSWRKNRKSPPRCLECGSFFAIHVLAQGKEMPHPNGQGAIMLRLGGHASTNVIPAAVFFNEEGCRID